MSGFADKSNLPVALAMVLATMVLAISAPAQVASPSAPSIPIAPIIEVRKDSARADTVFLAGPVFHRAAATSPRHLNQGPQNPVRVEVPRGLGAGWIILLGAALGVYLVYKMAECDGCTGVHPIVVVGAVLFGIVVVSILP
jgi:hypothetical protein